jgi:alkanesulfonate monooxygenase SsuD/methylene tetrahydromethanopterin reductase-like flavin-dependent oxidoreductase (luciferase family)
LSTVSPLGAGSVSLRLYPHDDLPAPAIVDEVRTQAALAAEHGFDGVMTSEHHGGFAGYLPNPLQAAGWCLETMATGWAAPCPLLLPLRPTALVAEETAWLAARFPGRVGIGVAAGALEGDFEIMGTTMDDLGARFATALAGLAGILQGSETLGLAGDPAIDACAEHPIPVVSAAMSGTAARRAAALGVGLLFDSLTTPERCRELVDAYRAAGGTGPCILVRRAWLGKPPTDRVERQVDVYRGYAAAGAQSHWEGNQLVAAANGEDVAQGLLDAMRRAGADSLNLRVHVPGVSPNAAREQIARLGDEALPGLRAGWPA